MAKSHQQLVSDADSWVKYRRWAKVSSSNVLAINYNIHSKILWVQFKGKAKGIKYPIYAYSNVPDTVAKAMYTCNSKGKLVLAVLRNGKYSVSGPT